MSTALQSESTVLSVLQYLEAHF